MDQDGHSLGWSGGEGIGVLILSLTCSKVEAMNRLISTNPEKEKEKGHRS